MTQLKKLSPNAVVPALEKAERYRLLNEPLEAESICLDILAVDPNNQQALVTLILAITDGFNSRTAKDEARLPELISKLATTYARAYFEGIVLERKAKAKLDENTPGMRNIAYDLLHKAMELFAKAEELRPAGNDDALLRWNTCVRLIAAYSLEASSEEHHEPELE